eukprot:SAG31_NODE_7414_length_1695_cov_4.439850_1_plen_72_part_00
MPVPAVHVRISRYFSPRGDSSTRYIYTILVPIKFNLPRNRRSLRMARPCDEHPNLKKLKKILLIFFKNKQV